MGDAPTEDYGRKSWLTLTGNGSPKTGLVYKVDQIRDQLDALAESIARDKKERDAERRAFRKWVTYAAMAIIGAQLGVNVGLPAAGVEPGKGPAYTADDWNNFVRYLQRQGVDAPTLHELRRSTPLEGTP